LAGTFNSRAASAVSPWEYGEAQPNQGEADDHHEHEKKAVDGVAIGHHLGSVVRSLV
jgi:hypothetical protein